ncbi:hypothetical protein G7Y89_g3101 [Cudoniella acicularis]|uniref:DUF8004 domain-containing protein n=1 Tax=Cudoniella acicularis TaxID=354080 RepID=A0A8H4RS28_9HELO|nr:hypothetical protein G7Y89_g3101 [Cudoniella acicularis]
MVSATSRPPSRAKSSSMAPDNMGRSSSIRDFGKPREFSLYKGVSNRPFGWKRASRVPEMGATARDFGMKKFDGVARQSTDWDRLRKDPDLWSSAGNCLVHLYERGQSRRGPAFKVPVETLLATNCQPLLQRFLGEAEYQLLVFGNNIDVDLECSRASDFELYIPAPPDAERGQAFLYHAATRNFFAWIFGKSLVGSHLGGALVGLLNSMNEFRSPGEDNVVAIMDFMDEEGYSDMRNSPDHALGVLFFAEHFHFRDLWIDAFAHCVGTSEKLIASPGFEFISITSRALITRSRLEMDMRLDVCGRKMESFLLDDLSDAHLGLPSGARAYLDKFRSFLHSYYIAKLGYYPPTSGEAGNAAFPKSIFRQMCTEFQKLYDFLVDSSFTSSDAIRFSQQGSICVLQSVQSFDQRHKLSPLQHPLPLLPEDENVPPKAGINKRFSWGRGDKMKPDPRLVTFAALSKATNREDPSLTACTLVRAYRGFEKDCIFNPSKTEKREKLSQADARKVRWILIYSILQTLLDATKVPNQVRDTHNVHYNLCVQTAGCPPRKERPLESLLCTQTHQTWQDYAMSQKKPQTYNTPLSRVETKPDIDYHAIAHRPQHNQSRSESHVSLISRRSTARKVKSTFGNVPELHHPRPHRISFHEILVHGYGNGTNGVNITAESSPTGGDGSDVERKLSESSRTSFIEEISSRWSNSSDEGRETQSPNTTISYDSQRCSKDSLDASKKSIREHLDRPMSTYGLARVPSSVYSASIYDEQLALAPAPLSVEKGLEEEMMIGQALTTDYEDNVERKVNRELNTYLEA